MRVDMVPVRLRPVPITLRVISSLLWVQQSGFPQIRPQVTGRPRRCFPFARLRVLSSDVGSRLRWR